MFTAIYLIVTIAISIFTYWASMRQKQAKPDAGTIDQTTVSQGDRMSKLYGTREVTGVKLAWLGDTTTEAIKQ